jgi:O-antigen ligase
MDALAIDPDKKDVLAFRLLLAFAVFLYAVPGEWIPSLAPLRLALVTTGLAAILMVGRRIARVEPLFIDGIRGAAFLAFVALAWLSVGWSVNPEETRIGALELLKVVAIYLAIINVVSTPRRLVYFALALILGSLVTSIGSIQWYLKGEDLVWGYRARWVGTYADPNYLAEHLSIIVPLSVAFLARRETRPLVKAVCAIAGLLAIITIVYTHSRGGFIGLTVGMALWALMERARRMQAITLGAALLLGLLVFAPKSFWQRTETVEDFREDASAMGRVYAWSVASRISMDRPLLGVGLDGFRYAWPLYAPPEARRAYVAHNLYLSVIGELGFLGLFFYLVFTGGAVGGAFAASRDKEVGWLARGLAGAAAGYLTCYLFAGSLGAPHLYVLVAMTAAAARLARKTERESVPEQPLAEPVFVGHPSGA